MSTPTLQSGSQVMRGIALRIGAAASFAVMGALLKLGSDRGAGVVELIFYRSLCGLPAVLLWVMAGRGLSMLGTRRPMAHVGRAALGVGSMFCVFAALSMLPLAEATTISFTGPIFATLLSWLILKEKVGRHRIFAGMIAFLGVIVVTRPGAGAHSLPTLGILIGLVAAFGQASVNVTLRHLADTEHVAAIVFWFLVACSLVGGLLLPFFGTDPGWEVVLILAAGGVAGGIAQIFMTASLQAAPIPVLAPFDYLQLVGALLLGWLLLGSHPTLYTYAGAGLIALSGLYTLWRERRRQRQQRVPSTQQLG